MVVSASQTCHQLMLLVVAVEQAQLVVREQFQSAVLVGMV